MSCQAIRFTRFRPYSQGVEETRCPRPKPSTSGFLLTAPCVARASEAASVGYLPSAFRHRHGACAVRRSGAKVHFWHEPLSAKADAAGPDSTHVRLDGTVRWIRRALLSSGRRCRLSENWIRPAASYRRRLRVSIGISGSVPSISRRATRPSTSGSSRSAHRCRARSAGRLRRGSALRGVSCSLLLSSLPSRLHGLPSVSRREASGFTSR